MSEPPGLLVVHRIMTRPYLANSSTGPWMMLTRAAFFAAAGCLLLTRFQDKSRPPAAAAIASFKTRFMEAPIVVRAGREMKGRARAARCVRARPDVHSLAQLTRPSRNRIWKGQGRDTADLR